MVMKHDSIGEITPYFEPPKRVLVGVGAMVIKDGRVLIGKRKGSHGAGKWAFPGGHQDFGESWSDCATREVMEETGMEVKFRYFNHEIYQPYVCVTNDFMKSENKHYATVYIVCDWMSGEPIVKEPKKCEGWQWVNYQELLDLLPPNAINYTCDEDRHECLFWFPLKSIEINLGRIGLLKE